MTRSNTKWQPQFSLRGFLVLVAVVCGCISFYAWHGAIGGIFSIGLICVVAANRQSKGQLVLEMFAVGLVMSIVLGVLFFMQLGGFRNELATKYIPRVFVLSLVLLGAATVVMWMWSVRQRHWKLLTLSLSLTLLVTYWNVATRLALHGPHLIDYRIQKLDQTQLGSAGKIDEVTVSSLPGIPMKDERVDLDEARELRRIADYGFARKVCVELLDAPRTRRPLRLAIVHDIYMDGHEAAVAEALQDRSLPYDLRKFIRRIEGEYRWCRDPDVPRFVELIELLDD